MLRSGLLAWCALALVLLTAPRAAVGEEPSTVVLVQPENPSPSARESTTRALAELGAAGFHVVVVTQSGTDTRASLDSAVTSAGAVAAIAIRNDPESTLAEVWVSDRVTGKLSIRPVETRGSGDTPALLAIRAVELLRASLIELRDSKRIADEAKPVPPAVDHFLGPPKTTPAAAGETTSAHRGIGVALGVAALFNVDHSAPAAAPLLRASLGSKMGLGGRVTWMGPSAGAKMKGPLGSAALTQEIALGELVFAPPLPRPFVLVFSTGIGMHHVGATGELANKALSKSGGSTAFLVALGAGGGLRLNEHFALELEVMGGISAPRIVIDMGGQRIGSLGRPLLGSTLALFASF